MSMVVSATTTVQAAAVKIIVAISVATSMHDLEAPFTHLSPLTLHAQDHNLSRIKPHQKIKIKSDPTVN